MNKRNIYGPKGSMKSKMALSDFTNTDFKDVRFTRDFQKNERAKAIAPVICKMAKEFGLDPVLAMSQWVIESGWGARNSGRNNPFGFTAEVGNPNKWWKGDFKLCKTWEEYNGKKVVMRRKFRSYDTVADGVGDYLRLIHDSKHYKQVREEGIVGLRVYATASNYVPLITKIYSMFEKIFEKLIHGEENSTDEIPKDNLDETIMKLEVGTGNIEFEQLIGWLKELKKYREDVRI